MYHVPSIFYKGIGPVLEHLYTKEQQEVIAEFLQVNNHLSDIEGTMIQQEPHMYCSSMDGIVQFTADYCKRLARPIKVAGAGMGGCCVFGCRTLKMFTR